MHGRRRLLLAVATVVALAAPTGATQSATAPVLMPAFLFTFAKFTEWPEEALAPGQPLTLRRLSAVEPAEGCHLLCISGVELSNAHAQLDAVRTLPTLTVSDTGRFAEKGIVQLVRDRDRMRFTINLSAAKRSRPTLNSRLLSVASLIQD